MIVGIACNHMLPGGQSANLREKAKLIQISGGNADARIGWSKRIIGSS